MTKLEQPRAAMEIARIARSPRDEFRLTVQTHRGRYWAELRVWIRASGKFQPTSIMTVLAEDQLAPLRRAITSAETAINCHRETRYGG